MTIIAERVERGAALLDERRPGWWQEIDLERLDIESKCGCVLGQLGDKAFPCRTPAEMYSNGLYLVRLDSDAAAARHGFDLDADRDALIDELGDDEAGRIIAWLDLIEARRAESAVTA